MCILKSFVFDIVCDGHVKKKKKKKARKKFRVFQLYVEALSLVGEEVKRVIWSRCWNESNEIGRQLEV